MPTDRGRKPTKPGAKPGAGRPPAGRPPAGRKPAGPGGALEKRGARAGAAAGPTAGGKPKRGAAAGPTAAEKRIAEATRGGKPAPAARDERARPGRDERARPERGKPGRDERGKPVRAKAPGGPRGERPARPPRDERPARGPRPERPPQLEAEIEEVTEAPAARDLVYGRHPALAALEGDRPVNKVWLLKDLKNQQLVAQVRQLAKEKGATVQYVERPKLDALTLDANHQGIVVSIASATYVDLDELITAALAKPHPALLVLDGIEDPHNLGALVRTAEGAGFAGVVIPARRAVGLTPVVAKASAGAIDRVPVARVGNLAQALETLKKAGFWLAGADAEGEALPYEVDMTRAIGLVIGGEGKGLSRLLAERCDHRVRLPLAGELESLNASVAGGVLMYEAVRQRWAGANG